MDDSKSGRARQANQAAHAGANISTAAPIKTAAWHVRHSGDRRMSQQSTAWGGTAARAGFMGTVLDPTEVTTSAVLAICSMVFARETAGHASQ